MGYLDSIVFLAKLHRFFFSFIEENIRKEICLVRKTIESKFPIVFRHFFFNHPPFFLHFKKIFHGWTWKKKRFEYVGKINSENLKPKTQVKTQKQKNSILAQKYVAKTTKKIFFVKVPSAYNKWLFCPKI